MSEKENEGNTGSDKVRLNLWITRRQHDELNMLAEYEGRSVSDIVRQVLGIHLRDNSDQIEKQREVK